MENPNKRVSHILKAQVLSYYKENHSLLLKCLSFPDSMEVMKQVHGEGGGGGGGGGGGVGGVMEPI